MRRFPVQRLFLTLTLIGVSLLPASLAQARRPSAATATVSMYAYQYTPTSGQPTAAQPMVYKALKVLAGTFEAKTGIHINFVAPVCVSIAQTCLTQTTTYFQAQQSANTMPDIVDIPNTTIFRTENWFLPLESYATVKNPYNTKAKDWCHSFAASLLQTSACDFDWAGSANMDNAQGHQWFIPFDEQYPNLVIGELGNANLMKKAGVSTSIPADWSEWMTQLATLKAKGFNAVSGETSHNGAGETSWPFWSALWPAYMGHVYKQIDPKGNPSGTAVKDQITPKMTAQAIKSGIINSNDPMYQAMFQQVKKYISYWVPGWQTSDVEALWTQGKLAERAFYIGDLFGEYSNPARHFNMVTGFPPIPTKKTDPRVMTPYGSIPTGPVQRQAHGSPYTAWSIDAAAVKRDSNLAAAIKWLQYITAPQQDQYVVNENPQEIPATIGATMAPLFVGLNGTPIPDWRQLGDTYPFGLATDATPNLEKELAVWTSGKEDDKTFFTHMESIMKDAANSFLATAK
jgi:hypothetical protein